MSMSDWELVDDGSWNGLRKWMRASDEDHGTVQVAYDQINLQQTLELADAVVYVNDVIADF